MAYTKHEWKDGEIITKELLNNIENGIATIELTPGPKGDKGETGATGATGAAGATGTRGSRMWNSTAMTGTEANTGTKFESSGITDALIYDYCLNKNTGDLYVCSKGGNASVSEWKWVSNLKGAKGDTGATGPKGADATIPKLAKIDALAAGADVATVVTAVNSLIADLKAKGYMLNA